MAIINPRNLYSGGDVVLNANPYTNFFITALARKQAQQDSLDQYYRNTQDRLSQNQIRPVDAEGFQNKFAGLQNYYLQNKKAILSGNVAANSQYEQQYRDLISDAQKSKAAAGQELLMAQHHFSGKWQPTDEDFHTVIPAMSASIYDSKHYKDQTMTTPYGVNDTSVYTPDLDEKKYLQTITFGQKPSETPTGQPENLGGFRRRQNYQIGYNDQQLKNFGDKAMSDAATNPSVKKLASNRYDFVDLNPAMKDALNSTFKQYYGKDAQSPSDFYAAEVINNLSPKETKTKDYEDSWAKDQQRQKERLQLAGVTLNNAAFLKKNVPTYKELQASDDDAVSSNRLVGEVSNILRNGTQSQNGDIYSVDINDPQTLKDYKNLAPSTTSPPSNMRYNRLTDKLSFIYKTKDGEESVNIDPLSYLQYKVKQRYPNKDISQIGNIVNKLYEDAGHRLDLMAKEYENLEVRAAQEQQAKKPYKEKLNW